MATMEPQMFPDLPSVLARRLDSRPPMPIRTSSHHSRTLSLPEIPELISCAPSSSPLHNEQQPLHYPPSLDEQSPRALRQSCTTADSTTTTTTTIPNAISDEGVPGTQSGYPRALSYFPLLPGALSPQSLGASRMESYQRTAKSLRSKTTSKSSDAIALLRSTSPEQDLLDCADSFVHSSTPQHQQRHRSSPTPNTSNGRRSGARGPWSGRSQSVSDNVGVRVLPLREASPIGQTPRRVATSLARHIGRMLSGKQGSNRGSIDTLAVSAKPAGVKRRTGRWTSEGDLEVISDKLAELNYTARITEEGLLHVTQSWSRGIPILFHSQSLRTSSDSDQASAHPLSETPRHSRSTSPMVGAPSTPLHEPCDETRSSTRGATQKPKRVLSSPALSKLGRASGMETSDVDVPTTEGILLRQLGVEDKEVMSRFFIDADEITIGALIGVGASGEVYRALYKGQTVAVKVLKSSSGKGDLQCSTLTELRRELGTLILCADAPNLLKFYGFFIDAQLKVGIVTQYMEGATLLKFIRRQNGRKLHPEQYLGLARDIARGMTHLHSAGITHRDLKSDNVLLDSEGHATICDFGVARADHETGDMTNEVGTYRWMAPECFGASKFPVTHKADAYSFGVILWELATLSLPFAELSNIQTAIAVGLKGQQLPIPGDCAQGLRELIEQCWGVNPEQRPEFTNILSALEAM